jgi:hypothetical protein
MMLVFEHEAYVHTAASSQILTEGKGGALWDAAFG